MVLGRDADAVEAAKKVASRLDVTVVLEPGAELLPPRLMDVPVFTGRVTGAEGHLGQFQVTIEDFAPATPSSRTTLGFEAGTQTGTSVTDLILDLRGETPLLTAPGWRISCAAPSRRRSSALPESRGCRILFPAVPLSFLPGFCFFPLGDLLSLFPSQL